MKHIHTVTTFLLVIMISSLSQTVQAQKCSDVCPNEDRKGCWVNSTTRFCICPEGKVAASYELHKALESLTDTNGDGILSRDEFENAHHDTSDILTKHCVHINEADDTSTASAY